MNEEMIAKNLGSFDVGKLMNRGGIDEVVLGRVKDILKNVRERKLQAVLEYTKKFDGIELDARTIVTTKEEIAEAYTQVTNEQLGAIRESIKLVTTFCSKQKEATKDITLASEDGEISIRWTPIRRAGIYVPAGKAPLPSSVLMAAIPARIAGVNEAILCSPPQKNGKVDPSILVTANECKISKIFKIGGAQAIGAMAYGCELFSPVQIIAGPGNVYTAYAKQVVSGEGTVKIDTLAGPSEVMVIADETANPKLVASDMLAQAEHGTNSSAICITTSTDIASRVCQELKMQLDSLPNNEPVWKAITDYGAVLVAKSMEEILDFVNSYAAEHVEVYTINANELAKKITNAGAVFVATGEAFGDYGMSGGNHILPTGRAALFTSGVSVYSFMKYQYVETLTGKAQARLAGKTAAFARLEGLEAHARSADFREGMK